MSQTSMTDDQARDAIRHRLHDTVVVEAAAGTGKTTELVTRMIGVIRDGLAEMRQIVAVTFTEKAAGELKLRLRQRLEAERRQADGEEQAARFERAVQTLEEAHVGTIHGFCADLLRERPVEARIDPGFTVLTEGQADRLFSEAFDGWMRGQLESPSEAVRRSLRRASRASWMGDGEDGPVERLRRAARELCEWRDFRAPWTRLPFDRDAEVLALLDQVHALAATTAGAASPRDNLYIDTEPVRALSAEVRRRAEEGAPPDLDGLESALVELSRNRDFTRARKGSGASYATGVPRASVVAERDALRALTEQFRLRADADLAAALQGDLLRCIDRYEALKHAQGALDFLDLLMRARDLVRDDQVVRAHFQRRFARLFVDEFQDTDPLQAELLLLLAADEPEQTDWRRVRPMPGKLFIVGDPKQAIYRFRRADVAVYQQVCEQVVSAGGLRVELRRSFRSVPALHHFVNTAFEPLMDGRLDAQQARYVALEGHREDHQAQPALVALPVPLPYGQRLVSAKEIEASLPDAVGAFVHWLVTESGWTVTERRGRDRVPIEGRHICILFRRLVSYGDDVTRPYLDALEARGVRHLLVGGRAFHGREEIETMRAALRAIEWPDDALSVFATLRGGLFAIGDEELLEFQHRGGVFHPFRPSPEMPPRLAPVREALDRLAALHVQRNRRPVADTITALLTETRAHIGFVLRPAGEQVLANVLHVAELARQYEAEGGMSFRGLVEALCDDAVAPRTTEAPILEESSDGVRLMTVHKAKGLEFPVVILADITAKLSRVDAARFVDADRHLCAVRLGGWAPHDLNAASAIEVARDQAEGERLAYVAATRARDLLVVPGVGDGPHEGGWVSPLNPALYPPEAVRRSPEPGPGCPRFTSRDTVLRRPDGDPARSNTVAPGAYQLGGSESGYQVVWWSPEPKVLALDARPPFGLRRDDLIVKDVPAATEQQYLDEYHQWREQRAEARRAGAAPEHRVRTVTELAADPASGVDGTGVAVERVPAAPDRPRGARFGSLVHALLADMPIESLGRDDDEGGGAILRRLADTYGVWLAAPTEEVLAAVELVRQVRRHPLLREAAEAHRAGQCHREVPVTYRMPDGTLAEGTVDLAFRRAGEWMVVDFKTDLDVDDALEAYRRQVQLYVSAMAEATGLPARGVVLRV